MKGVVHHIDDIKFFGGLEQVSIVGILSYTKAEVIKIKAFFFAVFRYLIKRGARVTLLRVFPQIKMCIKIDDADGLAFFFGVQIFFDAIIMPIGHIVSATQNNRELLFFQENLDSFGKLFLGSFHIAIGTSN